MKRRFGGNLVAALFPPRHVLPRAATWERSPQMPRIVRAVKT